MLRKLADSFTEHAWCCIYVLFVGASILIISLLFGCAAGRGPDGTTVVGFPLGDPNPEAAGESALLLGKSIGGLFGPAGVAIGGSVAAAVAGIFGWNRASGTARAERARREAADAAWDEAEARTINAYRPAVPVAGGVSHPSAMAPQVGAGGGVTV